MTERLAPAGTAMPPARTFTTTDSAAASSSLSSSSRYSLIASATK